MTAMRMQGDSRDGSFRMPSEASFKRCARWTMRALKGPLLHNYT